MILRARHYHKIAWLKKDALKQMIKTALDKRTVFIYGYQFARVPHWWGETGGGMGNGGTTRSDLIVPLWQLLL